MNKPKVAFFDFACCEGCQLQVANLGESLLDILEHVDVVEFREVMSEKWNDRFNVAIVEGSITNQEAEDRIKEIRSNSDFLVAYGACATIGGVNGMKNNQPLEDVRREVYKDKAHWFDTFPTKSLSQVVKVDYLVHGCPVYPPEFIKVLKAVLAGLPYDVPDYAVCVECKLNENVCMYEKGVACMGPLTRAGCNSWCVNNGNKCFGCRGLLSNPNEKGAVEIMKEFGIQEDFIINKMNMYNSASKGGENE